VRHRETYHLDEENLLYKKLKAADPQGGNIAQDSNTDWMEIKMKF
jgi:hypothetical protein